MIHLTPNYQSQKEDEEKAKKVKEAKGKEQLRAQSLSSVVASIFLFLFSAWQGIAWLAIVAAIIFIVCCAILAMLGGDDSIDNMIKDHETLREARTLIDKNGKK